MADAYIRLAGDREFTRAVAQLRDTAGRFTGTLVTVGSDKVYSFGIETGVRRSGALARKAGGAYYLRGGLEAIQDNAVREVAAALNGGPNAVDQAMAHLGSEAVARAQEIVPVRSGALKNSIVARPRNAG